MAEARKIRYAVVGAGNIAQVAVLPAFEHARENSELVAIVSGDPEKRAELTKRYDIAHSGDYAEFEAVLERAQADAVYIALPNSQHREYTERAARAGAHVLCEKPMAEKVADCEAMIQACRDHEVRLMIAYRLHFEEATLKAIEIAQSGKLGQLRMFTSIFSQQVREGDIRTQSALVGGAIYDMGVYPINAVRNLFRAEPEEVFATCVRGKDPRFDGVDEITTAVLRFADGRVAQLSASLAAADVSSYRIVGSAGDLRVEPAFEYRGELKHYLTLKGKTTETTFEQRDQFAPELITFSRCILAGEEPEASGEEGLADVRIVQAILESAKSGETVNLPPFQRSARPDMRQQIHAPAVGEVSTVNAPSPSQS
jgi:predicted dehydrogenase